MGQRTRIHQPPPVAARRRPEAADRSALEDDRLRQREGIRAADRPPPLGVGPDQGSRERWAMHAQRTLGNHAVQRLLVGATAERGTGPVVQRDPAAGVPSDGALDTAMARFVAGVCGQYFTYEAPGAPVIQTKTQTWKTFSGGSEIDEDHFYDSGQSGDQPHVKVRATRGVGPDLRSPTGDTFWGRIVTWNTSGQETTVKRFNGWLEVASGAWTVHSGDKPAPPSPPPSGPPSGSPGYGDDDEVPV